MSELYNITEGLLALVVSVDTIKPDEKNARVGHNIERIANSLTQYGQRKPIVVNSLADNTIIAGNGTYFAAMSLGWTHIACVFVKDDNATATGYAIADNRLAELSTWDFEILTVSLDELDVETFELGFTEDELENLRNAVIAQESINYADEVLAEFDIEPGELKRSADDIDRLSKIEDFIPISFSVTESQRDVIWEALRIAKNTLDVDNSSIALAHIAQEFLEANG